MTIKIENLHYYREELARIRKLMAVEVEKTGVVVGAKVKTKKGIFVISGVEINDYNVRIYAYPFKKNGELSKAYQQIAYSFGGNINGDVLNLEIVGE